MPSTGGERGGGSGSSDYGSVYGRGNRGVGRGRGGPRDRGYRSCGPPLPAEHIEATGIKRQQYGNAGRTIRLRNGYAEVKLD